jgi:hypothetical protein
MKTKIMSKKEVEKIKERIKSKNKDIKIMRKNIKICIENNKKDKELLNNIIIREDVLRNMAIWIKDKLKDFKSYKFEKVGNTVIFSGNLKHIPVEDFIPFITGKSICSIKDKFVLTIGKYIALKKALEEDYREVYDIIEDNEEFIKNKMLYGGFIKDYNYFSGNKFYNTPHYCSFTRT